MATYATYAATPGKEAYYDAALNYASPTPTPSPRAPYYAYPATPQRPATRAHFRGASTGAGFDFSSPRPTAFSPRYTSDGQYATDSSTPNVSGTRSSRKHSFSGSRPRHEKRERRNSEYAHHRPSAFYEESDESDEFEYVRIEGVTYAIPTSSAYRQQRHVQEEDDYNRRHHHRRTKSSYYNARGYGTDTFHNVQTTPSRRQQEDFERREQYESPRFEPEPPRRSHSRRMSSSTPQRPSTVRPQTARPSSSHHKKPSPPPERRKATKLDAEKHRLPAGYSLKNWDPTEEPLVLLGSVFDANNLGKWIYDWTVYVQGSATPIAEMAGELWILLINLSGKIKRAEETIPRIRAQENRELIEDFIASGERLMDKLQKLLKVCEQPMLAAAAEGKKKSSSKKDASLGKNSGVEFVKTLFGRERELAKTEKFMQSIRLWKLRFDANCDEVLNDPTM